MKVVFFHRKPVPGNYSIEQLFNQIRLNLPNEIKPEVEAMRFASRGIWRRFYCGVQALLNQGDINHVTGDIHFITLFLRPDRTILTIHDVGFMNHPNALARLLLKWFWITLPARRCRVITTVSMATKLEILTHTRVSPSKIRVIHNPVAERFKNTPKKFNRVQPIILQIGTKFNKNIERLIQALYGIECRLVIVGELQTHHLKLLEENKISFENYTNLSNEDIINCYQESDIVSFVSIVEGFGLPIIEANAIGRAVITSSISSMPEIAGDSAHLVDPFNVADIRNGFQRIIWDDVYRENLIQKGFQNKTRFDMATIVEEYAQLYHYVLE